MFMGLPNYIEFVNVYGVAPKFKSLPQRFENKNVYINETYLIKGFGRASSRFWFGFANWVGPKRGATVTPWPFYKWGIDIVGLLPLARG